jgi:hypothetical protein
LSVPSLASNTRRRVPAIRVRAQRRRRLVTGSPVPKEMPVAARRHISLSMIASGHRDALQSQAHVTKLLSRSLEVSGPS